MGDRSGAATEQQSLFGRNERAEQLRRLVFPHGLQDKHGKGVSPTVLKAVLLAIDDRDQGGYGGQGCTASAETLAIYANVGRRTCIRALEVLTDACGFVTHAREQKWLSPIVERRICWAAIRAFNEGESLGGECHLDRGECHLEHEVSATGGTLNVSLKPKKKESKEGSGGLFELWEGGRLAAGELSDLRRLVDRFIEAAAAGLVRDCDADRLAFVAWASYCRREAREPAAMFTAGLLKPDRYGRTWRQKVAGGDEEQARAALKAFDTVSRGGFVEAPKGCASEHSARESPAERIRRMYRSADRTQVLWIARQRLGRASPEYGEFVRVIDSGGIGDAPEGLLLRVFGRVKTDGRQANDERRGRDEARHGQPSASVAAG